MDVLLQAEHLSVAYNGKEVVKDINFTLKEGEILGIVGESGSGKSTIIKAAMRLLGGDGTISGGTLFYKGQDIQRLSEREIRALRGPEMGMIFQDCGAALCPVRTIGKQICESLQEHEKISDQEVYLRAKTIMDKIGLTDTKRIWKSYPFELSGGMNQRVGICMALLMQPSLLLADEPTSALDVTMQKQVVEEMKLLRQQYHTAMILVTHNIGVVRALADRMLVLKDGIVQEYGDTMQVLEQPQNEYTRKLLGSVLRLRRKRADGKESGSLHEENS